MNNNKLAWSRFDTHWVLGLFGTAVGAGILFLPIRAGASGFSPLIIMTILILPMTYLAHKYLAVFVASSKNKDSNITNVVEDSFGKTKGKFITLLYVFALYPICLAYAVGVTNTVNSFLVNQIRLPEFPRWLLAFLLVSFMMLVVIKGQKFMLKVTAWLVYPLIFSLFFFSVYLIPEWKLSALSMSEIPSLKEILVVVWITIPVLVFAFNHSPAISSFAVANKNNYYEKGIYEQKNDQILFRTAVILTLFIMFFVMSCVLTLSPEQLLESKEQNLPILSYIANLGDKNVLLLFLGPFVAFTAIVSSFFGHYLGAKEGIDSLIYRQFFSGKIITQKIKKLVSVFTNFFIYLSMIVIAVVNPSILGFIEDLGGPIIAAILFLMPIYAIYKLPQLEKYRKNKLAIIFILIMGLVAISRILYKLLSMI